jgi:hypothetical protein
MRIGLIVLAVVLLGGGCASRAATPSAVATPRTPAPSAYLKTFASKDLHFSVTYDASRLTARIVGKPEYTGGWSMAVSFIDRGTRDRPFGSTGPAGSLYIFATEQGSMIRESPPSLAAGRALMKMIVHGLERPPDAVKGMATSRVTLTSLKGLSGYQFACSWSRGSSVTRVLSKGLYSYFVTLTFGRSTPFSHRRSLYDALQSFTFAR